MQFCKENCGLLYKNWYSFSLKDKRGTCSSPSIKNSRSFSILTAEIGTLDSHRKAIFAVATANRSKACLP